jgi:CheY-like chemotaxis protein
MSYYCKALQQRGYAVKHCLDPDSALEYAKSNRFRIGIIILDIMMPPGEAYSHKDTNEGLLTGVFLFDDLRKYCEDVPVVVLTNVRNAATLNNLSGKSGTMVLQKKDCPPFELAELVAHLITPREQES